MCREPEHRRRMTGRSPDRIERALQTRGLYQQLPHPVVNITQMTVAQTVDAIVTILQTGQR